MDRKMSNWCLKERDLPTFYNHPEILDGILSDQKRVVKEHEAYEMACLERKDGANARSDFTITFNFLTRRIGFTCKGVATLDLDPDDLRLVHIIAKKDNFPVTCVLLSVYTNESDNESDFYFLVHEDILTLVRLVNDCRRMVHDQAMATGTDPQLMLQDIHPLFVGNVDCLLLQPNPSSSSEENLETEKSGSYLCVIDKERFTIFLETLDGRSCLHLFFFKESTPASIDRVLEYHGEDMLKVSSPALAVNIKQLREKYGKIRTILIEAKPRSSSSFRHRSKHRENELVAAALITKASDIPKTKDDSIDINSLSCDFASTLSELQEFLRALSDSKEKLNEESIQLTWIATESDLQTLMANMKDEEDFASGGLDCNNPKHFISTLENIEEHMKENRYEVALSRLKSCRDLFSSSNQISITAFLANDDIKILEMLFFHSYFT